MPFLPCYDIEFTLFPLLRITHKRDSTLKSREYEKRKDAKKDTRNHYCAVYGNKEDSFVLAHTLFTDNDCEWKNEKFSRL